jgi:hypothetical protein
MQGIREQLTNWQDHYAGPLTLEDLKKYLLEIFDTKREEATFSFMKYCPHQETHIVFIPDKGVGCEKCYEEMVSKYEQ